MNYFEASDITFPCISFQKPLPHALPDAPLRHRPQPDEGARLPEVPVVPDLGHPGGRGGLQYGETELLTMLLFKECRNSEHRCCVTRAFRGF